jgi:hypothetical protein
VKSRCRALGRLPAAGLKIDGDRELGPAVQLGPVLDDLLERHVSVGMAERLREARARARERLEAERGQDTCRAGIPRVRDHERIALWSARNARASCCCASEVVPMLVIAGTPPCAERRA